MKKHLFLQHHNRAIITATTAAASLLAIPSCKNKEEQKPLNIVVIMSDDHSYQTISCFDNRFINTPNIDRLAGEGVRFTNSFVCNSISGPSRATLLTGKYSHNNGYKDNISEVAFDCSQQTVQTLLQAGGYQTAIIGKWHLGGIPAGFDYWNILPGQGDYYNPDFISEKHFNDPLPCVQLDTVIYDGYVTNIITDLSVDWLRNSRDPAKPFCMFVHHKAAHRNWMADTTHLQMFEDDNFPLPDNFYDDYVGRKAAAKQEMSIDKDMTLIYDLKMLSDSVNDNRYAANYNGYDNSIYGRMNEKQKAAWNKFYQPVIDDFVASNLSGKELAEWKYQRYMRDYLKVIQSLDENVGRLLKELEDEGLLKNTVVIYLSDQGFYMGEHGWFDKRFMYEESMRTPLVMRLPECLRKDNNNIDESQLYHDIPQLVQNIDLAPTMLDIAGLSIPEDMDGMSLLPLIEGKDVDWREWLYYHYYEYPAEHSVCRHYGIRTERYKLIHFYYDIDEWELYDLYEDPHEMHNLYGQPAYDSIVEALGTRMDTD